MGIASKTRMYNAGDRLVDTLLYTLEDGHDPHCVASYVLDMPREDFFECPDVLMIRGMKISVHFADTILTRFAGRGVIAIDANYEPAKDADQEKTIPIARTAEVAVEKGRERWKEFYLDAARKHIEQCQNCRASNMPPVPAAGFTKRALILAGLSDPADAYLVAAQSKTDDISTLREQLNKQAELIQTLLSRETQANQVPANGKKPKPAKQAAA